MTTTSEAATGSRFLRVVTTMRITQTIVAPDEMPAGEISGADLAEIEAGLTEEARNQAAPGVKVETLSVAATVIEVPA
jgi:hypothetical protein